MLGISKGLVETFAETAGLKFKKKMTKFSKIIIFGITTIFLAVVVLAAVLPDETKRVTTSFFKQDVSISSSAPFFPTQKEPATAFNQALLSGILEELDGCLRVNGDLIVWPYGFSLSVDENSILDDTGHGAVRVGDKVRFSGGGFSEDEIEEGVEMADILGNLSAELPSDRCSGPYWAIGEII